MKHRYRFLATLQKFTQKEAKEETYLWQLRPEEIHHFRKVLRLKEKDEVEVFDGEGLSAVGFVVSVSPKEVLVQTNFLEKSTNLKPQIALALAVFRTSLVDTVLAELVELGVDKLFFFAQNHSSKQEATEKNLQRWQKIILASSKQSKRNFIPKVFFFKDLSDFLKTEARAYSQRVFLSAEAKEVFEPQSLFSKDQDVLALLGSEADLSLEEKNLLEKASFKKAQLGTLILRARTASIVSAALLSLWRFKHTK